MNNGKKRSFSKHKLKAQITMHAMMLPAVIFAIIFSIVPLYGLIIAFKDYRPLKGIEGSNWVGFKNFAELFTMPDFGDVLSNTIIIAVMKIIAITILSIVMALLINEIQSEKLKKIIQVTIFLPYFLSWVLIGNVFVEMFSSTGVVNTILSVFGVAFKGWLVI